MTFRFRSFLPYTLPGVLALIGWWWFFSRKKQRIRSHDEHKAVSIQDQQTKMTKIEPVSKQDLRGIKARTVQTGKIKCQVNDILCTESSVEVKTPPSEILQPLGSSTTNLSCPAVGSVETNILLPDDKNQGTCKKVHENSSTVQEYSHPGIKSSEHHNSFRLPRVDSYSQEIQIGDVMVSPVIAPAKKISRSSGKVKRKYEAIQVANKVLDNKAVNIKYVEEASLEIGHVPGMHCEPKKDAVSQRKTRMTISCEQLSQPFQLNEIASLGTEVYTTTLKEKVVQPAKINEMLFMDKGSQTAEEKRAGDPEIGVNENMALHTEFSKTISTQKVVPATFLKEKTFEPDEVTPVALTEKDAQAVILKKTVQNDKVVAMEKDVHMATSEGKTLGLKESSDTLSLEKDAQADSQTVQCKDAEEITAVENEESMIVGMLLNSYMASDLREDDGPEIVNTLSHCPGNASEYCETARCVVDSVGKEKAEEDSLVRDEAEKIEQVAINIISKVILAATKEILSCAATDMSDNCKVLKNESDCLLERENDTVSGSASQEKNMVKCSRGHETDFNTNTVRESTLSEEDMYAESKDYVSILKNVHLSNLVYGDSTEHKPKNLVQNEHREKNLCSVPRLGESFEETNIVAEDSGYSACTSEDGIGAEDPLQSTGLSCIVANQHFDSFNASRIGDASLDQSIVPTEESLAPELQENKNVPYSNGVQRGSSPDLRNDGHWSAETEADHSGGSDVNSMDSVDSGCAPGKIKNIQNDKQGTECKKSELIIWEIEVPKHLVGRLIGKQGRYVSFLKQTSGAKIYISTLHYTQEFQICHLEGSQPQVDTALDLIGKKFKELNLTNIYAPPPPLTLPSLPMTSWLMLPDGITIEVIVVNVVNAGHMFVQQHTHPTFHALRSLDQQMYLCYSQTGIPTLPTPVEVGVICAAPGVDGAWWRAQVVAYYKDGNEVEIRYVDYGGYERVKIEILRQIRSDFVTLPFQGAEVLLDNVIPLPDEDRFPSEADAAVNEMTRDTALLAQVTNYDGVTGLPFIQLWSMLGDEVVSINRALVERGFAQWIDNY
ncbi:A-kinase anchor protein 1, mitochondrial [Rhinatrema bivittatum]|uniref:A-kinase anchor protein 1, mitochondrial n=1 Tax=Rhinatrema bivittatum TaxID=194408 RepID=UPI00112BDF2E|nr:A-kinase anchor protein 1, mitochondrial [Rhinatrema bivittatum]XP_029467769.1 A-kinase anchor protein 1, mitochondrial [Rhinatrema bivittatum]